MLNGGPFMTRIYDMIYDLFRKGLLSVNHENFSFFLFK